MDPAAQELVILVQNPDDYNVKFSAIYDVPDILKDVSPRSFIPRVVSIGPLHKGLPNLKSVESRKHIYLNDLLFTVSEKLQEIGGNQETLEEILDSCIKKVRESMQEIKRSYFRIPTDTDEDELVQMMVMDACYILQFIDKLPTTGNPFSDNKLRSRNIALDLVLLENQIPFFVLQAIYDLTFGRLRPEPNLNTMLKVLLDLINPFEEPLIRVEDLSPDLPETPTYHILSLLHKFYDPNIKLPRINEIPTAHSAVELDKVGVKIGPNKNLTWPMAMNVEHSLLSRKPTLKIPVVRIDNFFEVVLRNLIAYEQYSPVKNYVTSYAMAMHMLAATPADIAKMGKSGVIVSHLGSNEKASEMISSICKNVNLQDFYYTGPWKKIVDHYNSCWARNFGLLKRTYFDTPWKAIAVLAAITVFLMTVIQFFRQVVVPFV